MKRQVRIKDTQTNNWLTKTVEARTFKELREELSDITFEKRRVVVRETRVTLQLDNAQLPEGDFTLYIFPEKTKLGSDVANMGYQELRRLSSSLGLPANGVTMEEMRNNINAHRGDNPNSSSSKQDIIDSLHDIIVAIEHLPDGDLPDYLLDAEKEISEIKKELGL